MEVNHYLVSGIQVVGLIVGLIGFFYLSLSLFGATGVNFIRPLLPAAASATLGGLAFGFAVPRAGNVGVAIAILFIVGYGLGYLSQPGRTRPLDLGIIVRFVLASVIGNVVASALEQVAKTGLTPQTTASLVNTAVFSISVLGVTIAAVAPIAAIRYLSTTRLQYVGFTASVLAILTQFIPPVLDLLNIPIR